MTLLKAPITRNTILAMLLVGSIALSGCTAPDDPQLIVRHTAEDSLALLAVDKVSTDFSYGDLLIMVDNEPWKLGGHMDAGEQLYEVEGKDNKDDMIAIGDTIRIPVAGDVDIELRHARTGDSLQQLNLLIEDLTAPATTTLLAPAQGGSSVQRQAVFMWSPVSDASGVAYELEYWLADAPVSGPAEKVSNLHAASYNVPKSAELLPSATYQWHVRAIDGFGNVGEWSEEWEFQTDI